MLKFLREFYPKHSYPAKWTLFKTPTTSVIPEPMDSGEYAHFGIQNGIKSYGPETLKEFTEISIDVGIDGFALSKSSTKCGWPILGAISKTRLAPFLIGMYVGQREPKNMHFFLGQFVDEAMELMKDGIELAPSRPKVPFKIRCFTTDTPARSKITCTSGHGGEYSCHKCDQRCHRISRCNFYDTKIGNLRTDYSFRHRLQPQHHKENYQIDLSPLEHLGVDMIASFPIDVMHLVDMGVTKAIIKAIVTKKCLNGKFIDVNRMCEAYAGFKSFKIPEFARPPRSLLEYPHFKATEFRQFVLYGGIVLLKQFLSNEQYVHFLRLSLGYRIVSGACFQESLSTAQVLFEDFVADYKWFILKEDYTTTNTAFSTLSLMQSDLAQWITIVHINLRMQSDRLGVLYENPI